MSLVGISAVPAVAAFLGMLEALAEKREQLVRGSKPYLASGVDLFDPAFELPSGGLCLRAKLKNERPSHHTITIRSGEATGVKVAFNFT